MTQDQTPSLRFPEFQGKDPWEEILIGQILSESKVPSKDNDPKKRITVKLTLQGIVHRNFKGTEAKNATKHFVREAGQFIYGKQNIHKGAFGIIPNHLDGFETSQDLPAFDFTGLCHPSWFLYYIERENFYTSLEIKMSGTGSKRLKPEVFCGLTIAISPLPEQQKITECLSSLDEVITAQGDRLDGLKDYKRGLMQQLFPADGQTTPTLRFPEFQGTGAWEMKQMGEVFTRITAKNTENNQNSLTISAQDGLVNQLNYFNKKISAKDLSGYYLLQKDDFAYNKSYSKGYPMGAFKRLKLYSKGVISTLYICFRVNPEYSKSFFEYYFDCGMLNNEISKIAQEGARNHGLLNISVKDFFEKISVIFPNISEQKKIADCLSAMDELITAQEQKIKTLKHHKNGLMQQLFPKL